MKKFYIFKLFGLVGILIVTLVFVGINFIQAKGKPQNWGIKIPPQGENLNLYGMINTDGDPYLYSNDDPNIQLRFRRTVLGRGLVISGFSLWIYYSDNDNDLQADTWVGSEQVSTVTWEEKDRDVHAYEHFPPGLVCPPPSMDCFIERKHPLDENYHFFLDIHLSADIEGMEVDQPPIEINFSNRHDNVFLDFVTIWNCCELPKEDPYYSQVLTMTTEDQNDITPHGGKVVIARTGSNTWTIEVINRAFRIREYYCERNYISRGKKEKCESTIYKPYKGKANLNFKVELIKNPSQ